MKPQLWQALLAASCITMLIALSWWYMLVFRWRDWPFVLIYLGVIFCALFVIVYEVMRVLKDDGG